MVNISLLLLLGLGTGLLAGVLGIGGGSVLVPLIKGLGYTPVQAVGTSSLAIILTSLSASVKNFRDGTLPAMPVVALAVPALLCAQLGVFVATQIEARTLLLSFSIFLFLNVGLAFFKKKVTKDAVLREGSGATPPTAAPATAWSVARIGTGSLAGFLAGLFGIGGGVVLVPLQLLLLGEKIVVAIQVSLAVIVITSFSSCAGHALNGNILWTPGVCLGLGGVVGVRVSGHYLRRLPERVVTIGFNALLFVLACYMGYSGMVYQP